MTIKRSARGLFRGVGIAIIILIFIIPYLWLVGSAFKPRDEIFRNIYPFSWKTFIPVNPTLQNFQNLFAETDFARSIFLSLGIAVVSVAISLLICSMIAFVLARLEFPGRGVVFTLILATMLIPFEARIVPLFFVMQDLNLDNTIPAVFLPWVADAFIIFLLYQHLKELPDELYDSAVVDGCSHFRVYWNIMLPNITPVLISAGLIKFIWSWDSYIWPLIVLRDPSLRVVQVAIAFLFGDQRILWGQVFAASFISTLPILIIFILLQRHYIAGMTSSGIKG
jgi:multiple sugar transport system permease protein/putative chitobiose transport system permease protein